MKAKIKELRKLNLSESGITEGFSEILLKCFKRLESVLLERSEDRIRRSSLTITRIAKTLHILAPDFCIMWDKRIREEFKKEYYPNGKTPIDDASTYVDFMKAMNKFALDYSLRNAVKDINKQLSKRLSSGFSAYEITIPKLIDEYNWIRIYKEMELTFTWPP